MKTIMMITLALLLLGSVQVQAADKVPETLAPVLAKLVPGKQPDAVRQSPLKGIYEVRYGPRVFYISTDGRYVLSGELYDLANGTNLTERHRAHARIKALDKMGEGAMIVYEPKSGKAKYTISVFTDVDCPYCKKLHDDIKTLNDNGVRVRYLAFPRAGIGSHAYHEEVSIWCSKDRNAALDSAYMGQSVKPVSCDNPVQRQMALGDAFGVSGTPTIILPDGRMVVGYVPAQRLLAVLRSGS